MIQLSENAKQVAGLARGERVPPTRPYPEKRVRAMGKIADPNRAAAVEPAWTEMELAVSDEPRHPVADLLTLGEIATRTAMLNVACSRCDRRGGYRLDNLIGRHGADPAARVIVPVLFLCSEEIQLPSAKRCGSR
jgi:hypothetical protein